MTATVDFFFSFRSPYSYMAAQFAPDIERDYDATLRFRPVLPLAIREPDFFRNANLDRVKYIIIDWERRAEMLGLPHQWPDPDPIVQEFPSFEVAAEQPYIHRLSRLGVEAQRRGKGLVFAREVSRLIFGGTRGWNDGDKLAKAVEDAGLDLGELEAAVGDGADHDVEIEANQAAQLEAGHSGVPLFVYDGEPFFGQDRMDTLCWRLGKNGLGRADNA